MKYYEVNISFFYNKVEMTSGLVGLKTNMSLALYFSWQIVQNTVMAFPHSIYLFDLPFLRAHYCIQGVIQFDLQMKTLLTQV